MVRRSGQPRRARPWSRAIGGGTSDELLYILGHDSPSGPLVKFQDYRIISEVARGGMGIVYNAWQTMLDRRVALKVLPTEWLDDTEAVSQFQREARIAARLHHPNIVEVYDMGVEAGTPYFAMEFVEGEPLQRLEMRWQGESPNEPGSDPAQIQKAVVSSLREGVEGWSRLETQLLERPDRAANGAARRKRMARPPGSRRSTSSTTHSETPQRGPFRQAELVLFTRAALDFFGAGDVDHLDGSTEASETQFFRGIAGLVRGVASGLEYAHCNGVVHRDLKPSNLILETGGRLRIIDFGLACQEGQDDTTLNDELMGTPAYMSPEQAEGRHESLERCTDIYSLGATAYELLGGRPPFQGTGCQDTLEKVIHDDPPPLRQLNPRVPPDLEAIVMKCLRKDPRERYHTARHLARDLDRFGRGAPPKARMRAVS